MEMLDKPGEKMMVSTASLKSGERAARGPFQIIIINAMGRLGKANYSIFIMRFNFFLLKVDS